MDEKYIWPLLGVILGWLLSLITSAWKGIQENRRIIGRLLPKLIRLHRQIVVLQQTVGMFKDNLEELDTFDQMRRSILERHFLEPASQNKLLEEAIADVAGVYPVESLELQGIVDSLSDFKKSQLKYFIRNSEEYSKFLSVYDTGLDLNRDQLMSKIRKLARTHGIVTYFKVIWNLWRRERNRSETESFLGRLGTDLAKHVNEAHQNPKT